MSQQGKDAEEEPAGRLDDDTAATALVLTILAHQTRDAHAIRESLIAMYDQVIRDKDAIIADLTEQLTGMRRRIGWLVDGTALGKPWQQ